MRGTNGRRSGAAGVWALAWLAVWGVGCGGDDVDPDADVPVDGEVGADGDGDADPDVAPDGADGDGDGDGDADGDGADADAEAETVDVIPRVNALAVLTSDYATGSIAVIDLDTIDTTPVVNPSALAVHGDAMLSCMASPDPTLSQTFHVVERLGADRVRVLKLSTGGVDELAVLELEDGSNPQDAVPLSVNQYAVPLYERTGLAFADGALGGVVQTVDLAGLADGADGLPEMHRAVQDGDYLYVALQRLDRGGATWVPTGPGVLGLIALSADGAHTLVDVDPAAAGLQGVTLLGSNPVGPVRVVTDGTASQVMVATVGAYGANDGGLERVVDPLSGVSAGYAVTEEALGGDIGDWVVLGGVVGFAVVTVGFAEDRIVRFNLLSGMVDPEPMVVSGGYTLTGLTDLGDGRLVVADRTAGAAGIRLFHADSKEELTAAPIDVGLPPVSSCRP